MRYTHLDGITIMDAAFGNEDKPKKTIGMHTKEFKQELVDEILRIGVRGVKDEKNNKLSITKDEAKTIKDDGFTI